MRSYLAAAVVGHCRLLLARRPIPRLIGSEKTSPVLREKLALVLRIRDFAARDLGLPDNGSYRCYADIGRAAAVWTVFAAPELSVEPVAWRYPLVGRLIYRGFFSETAASRFAGELRLRGNDVYVRESPAYSTLGWFDDPALSTFIYRTEHEIAGLIFHELAHQKVFVRDDSFFNEAFAAAVEREGVRRWSRANAAAEAAAERIRRADIEIRRLLDLRERLAAVYASGVSRSEKLAAKGAANNALLARIAAYYSYLPFFEALLEDAAGDLPTFYSMASQLARLPGPAARREALAARSRRSSPPAT